MKAITLWQPWASLIAEGVKTIETRSWPAPAALVGERIAIHAAARKPEHSTVGEWHVDPRYRFGTWAPAQPRMWRDATSPGDLFASHESRPLPLGTVVATARLAACVPMVDAEIAGPHLLIVPKRPPHYLATAPYPPLVLVLSDDPMATGQDVGNQLPYGDFAPGRWAWMLGDIAPTTERCPADCRIIAGDGEDDFDAERGGHRVLTGTTKVGAGTLEAWATCPVCDGAGKCEPIPAKGRQKVWEWTR